MSLRWVMIAVATLITINLTIYDYDRARIIILQWHLRVWVRDKAYYYPYMGMSTATLRPLLSS